MHDLAISKYVAGREKDLEFTPTYQNGKNPAEAGLSALVTGPGRG